MDENLCPVRSMLETVRYLAGVSVGLGLALTGCIIIPLEPFSRSKTAELQAGITRPEEAVDLFANPDPVRSYTTFRRGQYQVFAQQNEAHFLLGGHISPFTTHLLILKYDTGQRLSEWHQVMSAASSRPATFKSISDGTQVVLFETIDFIFDRSNAMHYQHEAAFHRDTLRFDHADFPELKSVDFDPERAYAADDGVGYIVVLGTKKMVILAPYVEDRLAKEFRANDDRGTLYVQLANEHMTVHLDGHFVGRGWAEGYFCWQVAPGEHQISAYLDPKSRESFSETISIRVSPGSISFFDASVGRPNRTGPKRSDTEPVKITLRLDPEVMDEIRSKRLILDALPFSLAD